MPKTLNDWIGGILKAGSVATMLGTIITWIDSLAWLHDAKYVWLIMFLLFTFFLALWAIDRYIRQEIVTPIRDMTTALQKLEKTSTSLTCAIGTQSNKVEGLDGRIVSTYEFIRQSLDTLLKRIPAPPKTPPE